MIDVRQHLQKFLYSEGAFLPPLDKSLEHRRVDINHRSEVCLAECFKMCGESNKAQSQYACAVALRYGQVCRQALNFFDTAVEIIEGRLAARIELRKLNAALRRC